MLSGMHPLIKINSKEYQRCFSFKKRISKELFVYPFMSVTWWVLHNSYNCQEYINQIWEWEWVSHACLAASGTRGGILMLWDCKIWKEGTFCFSIA